MTNGHRGTRAVQRLVEHAPATGGLALWMHHQDTADTDAPALATNGHTLRYAPVFAALPLPQQTGWVAHAVLHVALRHAQRYLALRDLLGDIDLALFNTCADAIVNSSLAHLGWLQLPEGGARLDALLLATLGDARPADVLLLEWDVERLYRAVDDRRGGADDARRPSPQHPKPSDRDGPRAARVRAMGGPQHADLQPDDGTRGPPEADAEAARQWHERLLRAHAGDGDFSLLRTLPADLPRTHTPWEQVLRRTLARALSPRWGPSWSRPARSYIANQGRSAGGRRMPWEPGFSPSRRVPRLAVMVDVSGSVDEPLLHRFAREIESLTRRLEAGLVLVVGDDRVRAVQHFEPGRSALREIEFQGGGGTDFTPLLQEAEQHRPDIGIVLTDLQGPARHRPRWPVIWAVPATQADAVAPFGRVLVLR
jgi:predicted metal-dependent peptidase